MAPSDRYRTLATQYGQAAAVAALAAANRADSDAIEAVACGSSTTTLRAKVAAEIVDCLDQDTLRAAIEGEERTTVIEAALRRLQWVGGTAGHLDAMASALNEASPHAAKRLLDGCDSSTVRIALLEHVATWGTRPAGEQPTSTTIQALADLCPTLAVTPDLELPAGEPTVARARVILAAAVAGVFLDPWASPGVSLADVRSARDLFLELPAGTFRDEATSGDPLAARTDPAIAGSSTRQLAATLAAALWSHGGTLADVSAVYRTDDLAALDDADVNRWISEFACLRDNGFRPIDELLADVTASGRIRCTRRDFIGRTSVAQTRTGEPVIAFSVIAAFYDQERDAGDHTGAVRDLICGRSAHRYTDAEIVAGLAANPLLAYDINESVADAIIGAHAPAAVIDASMTQVGLGAWLNTPKAADDHRRRLRRTAEAAGFGPAHWTLTWQLLDDFHGTPEQLVDVVTELTPAP